ncbi:MAG: two-component system, OmpR family, sensor kinase [Pseudonocardiales bacterium]|nr:two-component system, OmpR family, sensor kinase [Pseudonocardiales bacterium]
MTRPPPAIHVTEVTEVTDTAEPTAMWTPPAPTDQGPVAAGKRHFRLLPNSLTARLVVGVVTLVIVLVAIVGSATYVALKSFLVTRLDQQLKSVATDQTIYRYLNSPQSSSTSPVVRGPQDIWVAILTTDGRVLQSVPEDESLHVLAIQSSDKSKLISGSGKARTISSTSGERLRVIPVQITLQSRVTGLSTHAVAIIGLSTNDLNATLSHLVVLETGIGAAAVALAAGLTAWGVRVGLRPLHRVTRTAQEVTAELGPDGAGLERRVPDADPSTEVGQVASSVNTLLGAVQNEFAARVRSEDRMRQFLADASHELRTPLTSIRGYAELSRLQGQSTNSAEDPMRRIEVEGTRMSRLVEDLLVLARGDDQDNPAVREPVDVDSLLTDALVTSESAHPERRFELVRSGGATVLGDRDQLLRMVLNLLNNAAVHTRPDGPIRLEGVAGHVTSGPAVALRVIDAGPGLPSEEAAHVFERFWRADKARSRAKGGSGLGMAIVAQIANGHAGSVAFESTVEAGTTVTVTLPMAPPAQPLRPGGTGPE